MLFSDQNIDIENPALLSWYDTQTLPVESGVVAVGLGQLVGKMVAQFLSTSSLKLRTSQS